MKPFLIPSLLSLAVSSALALSPGDIAFTGYNSDGNDNLSFVALVPIPSGTEIHFTDDEWTGSAFNADESKFTWTAGSSIAAGTIVKLDTLNGSATSNLGTVTFTQTTNTGIGNSAEIVYAYVGTPTVPSAFLTAISNNLLTSSSATVPAGLVAGTNAIEMNSVDADCDIAAYNAARTGQASFASYLPLLNNPANWITQDASGDQSIDTTAPDVPFSSTAFSITPPPITSVDLSKYVRVGRHNLPFPLASEASCVTYNWDTDTLFVMSDGGTAVSEVTKTGVLVGSMALATGGSPQGTEFYDTEGITYIGGGQFVMTEERDRQAVKFTYVAGGTLTRGAAQTVKLGTSIGNIGLEGLSYDPQTSGFIFTKETDPQGIFQTTIDFNAGTASNGSPSTVNSTNLFNPALAGLEDMSDVFAFSNLPSMTGQPQAGNMLILSQESGMIRNIDRSGNVHSTLTLVADAGNPLTIQNQTHEGVTMDRDGNIYVVNENGGGSTTQPQLWVFAPSSVTNTAPTALALSTASTTIPENQSTTTRIKMATLVVTDTDGVGVNQLTVSGADAASFEIVGSGLYLKAGTVLSYNTKPTYNVTVNVDDATVGATPDASSNFTLNISQVVSGGSNIRITEVAPWSSGNSPIVAADWFELTNTGSTTVDITGWKMYDSGAGGFGSSGPLNGITSIAPGESVIFVDGSSRIAPFITNWFGASAPVGLQIGYYGGPGLSTGGDAVNIYNAAGTVQASVSFGASDATAPYQTFDNTAGLDNTAITQLSELGTNGAFTAAATTNEIGSPGTATLSSTVLVSITATDASAAEAATDPGTFRISRTGSTTLAMDVLYSIATGVGQATSADYTPLLASPATIPAGQSFVDVTITPVDDVFGEGSETVTITLGDTGSYDVGSPASATVTITDNDAPNQAPTAGALNNAVTTITEITPTTGAVKVADIVITDDVQGTNSLAVSGTDAAFFEITGSALYLKAGTVLSFATKPSYSVTVEVDDTTVGATPDASVNYSLAVLKSPAPGSIIVSEVVPWASGNSPIAVDWYEVTNKGTVAVNITGWKWNDSANSFTTAVALNGITSIAPGESVIFLQTSDLAGKRAAFKTLWFGSQAPALLQFGNYTGPGLGTGGDAVNLYDTSGNKIAGVSVGPSPSGPYTTFDNAQGLSGSVTLASVVGVNGAFVAANSPNEIGSPGRIANPTFANWLSANGYTSGGFGSDSDLDGLTDAVEFFFNLNPNNGGDRGNLPKLTVVGGEKMLTFTTLDAAAGVTGMLEVSDDLGQSDIWTSAALNVDYEVVSTSSAGGKTTTTLRLLGAASSKFWRHRVTAN